jgi:hypothetical protein
MTQQIVLRSLEDLGQFADLIATDEPVNNERALVPQPPKPIATFDVAALIETLRASAQELDGLAKAEAIARQHAEEALARYRRLTGDATCLQRIALEAQGIADQASVLADHAFSPECQEGAARIAQAAAMVASDASDRFTAVTDEANNLTVRDDVARLLAEERDREEAARREAEKREIEARMAEVIAEVEALTKAGNFDEAHRMLGYLGKEHPNDPELASCIDNVRRREWAVKTSMAEQALRSARRNRRDPKAAVALLEPLDLSCVPDALARQIYGCWIQACHRLCTDDALIYSVGFCKGAVLVLTHNSQLEVVSAIGLPRWQAGRHFSRVALKGARPLKS